MNGGVERGAGRLCAHPRYVARAVQALGQRGALDAPCAHRLRSCHKFSSATRLRRMVKVVRSTETKLGDQWPPPLDCPGSVGTHGEAAGEHGGTARELMRHKACLTRYAPTRVKDALSDTGFSVCLVQCDPLFRRPRPLTCSVARRWPALLVAAGAG